MLPVEANGQPAVAAYVRVDHSYVMHSLQVFTATKAGIARTVVFVDPTAFAAFEVPSTLPAEGAEGS